MGLVRPRPQEDLRGDSIVGSPSRHEPQYLYHPRIQPTGQEDSRIAGVGRHRK
jgi:hypothetical protein